jgi:hypothetical protein
MAARPCCRVLAQLRSTINDSDLLHAARKAVRGSARTCLRQISPREPNAAALFCIPANGPASACRRDLRVLGLGNGRLRAGKGERRAQSRDSFARTHARHVLQSFPPPVPRRRCNQDALRPLGLASQLRLFLAASRFGARIPKSMHCRALPGLTGRSARGALSSQAK